MVQERSITTEPIFKPGLDDAGGGGGGGGGGGKMKSRGREAMHYSSKNLMNSEPEVITCKFNF